MVYYRHCMERANVAEALRVFASQFSLPASCAGGMSLAVPSLTGSAGAFLAASLAQAPRVVLVVTPGIPDADRLADDLNLVAAASVLEFPPKLDDDVSAPGLRIKTASALRAWRASPRPCVVVAPACALREPAPSGDVAPMVLAPGAAATFGETVAALAGFGYRRVPQVEREGDFSVRGGIVDAWNPGDELPTRAEFFGDDIESLRAFDPSTQRSLSPLARAEMLPARERGENGDGLLSLLPEGSAVVAMEHDECGLRDVLPSPAPFLLVYAGDPAPAGAAPVALATAPLPGFAELGADEAHHPELFEAARRRLEQHLAAAEGRGGRVFRIDDLSGGFEFGDLVVVTKSDRVFAKRRTRVRSGPPACRGQRLNDFDDIEPGELVVHVDYGIGRYVGSSEIEVNGARNEVFTVEYADGAKLHVPASHAHLLSRYVGVKGEEVRLHRLDGKRWEKDKLDAQRAVSDLAAALLETQARRETAPGFRYDVDCDGREAFEAAFPYEETADQREAIASVYADMAANRPMDRLVCGDAGYGKTEVAMRAAFVAAMNGKQVAVLAPTTVLAEQHFETFASRFDGTPVRIESVSRFQSPETRLGTFRRLETGVCDIVIGTHAILSEKIRFHDLGLIVIDEEQRFGVRHKEFLKRLRTTADVLTLSATPIPRTLYLSMTGARDLSLLRTPPRERVAVETRIVRDSDETVRSAVESEIARGGQAYFLHNRVCTIAGVAKRLKALCPGVRVVVAHGQMDSRTLARKMRDFERGAYDLLLSTTIIESGLDIPRANTILVDHAETFGMSDLYQLRGRVGRSARQGYAYFLLPASGDVDSDARERLKALKRHGGLGGGFDLAVRDLELRGAGNLLGSQQSGHIAAIGFGLYCQLLRRTIARMKGERSKPVVDVTVHLDFASPRLPYDYVEDDAQRLSLMKRLAEAQDIRAVNAIAAEMRDRFGPPPPAAEEFVRVSALRVRCADAGIGRIDVADGRAVFSRAGSRDIAFVRDLAGRTPAAKIAELEKIARKAAKSASRDKS